MNIKGKIDWRDPDSLAVVRSLCPMAGVVWCYLLLEATRTGRSIIKIRRLQWQRAIEVSKNTASKALGALESAGWIIRSDFAYRTNPASHNKYAVRWLRLNPRAIAKFRYSKKKRTRKEVIGIDKKGGDIGQLFGPLSPISGGNVSSVAPAKDNFLVRSIS